ncbi:MAG TPA: hypothetical protein PKY25_02605 [Bacilli bacterium]|nr:hypothetical protein [Bacilli bacterium]
MNNNNNNFINKEDLAKLKKELNSFNMFIAEKKKSKVVLTESILGKRFSQFVGEEAVEVGMDHYYLSNKDENMFTLDVAPCCAIYVEKDLQTFLMHISPIQKVEDIINLLSCLSLSRNANVTVFPGPKCKTNGSNFDYLKLVEELKQLGNDVDVNKPVGEYLNLFVFGRDLYIYEHNEFDDKLSKNK